MQSRDVLETKGMILGLGNPLLDISACVDEAFLEKYGLLPNDAIMAEAKHMPLYKELVEKYQVEYIAGGSVLNTLRVAQWILKKPHLSTYFGCVGNDENARIMKERSIADGVKVHFQETSAAPTGTCAVLITGTRRSLCANLAAAQQFTPDHLASDESKRCIEAANMFYVSGFFVAVSPKAILMLAEHALKNNKLFAMNLSAVFVSQLFKEQLEQILPYVDVLFGNETEVHAFAQAFDIYSPNYEEVGKKASALPKLNTRRQRLIVITFGSDPVMLVEGDSVTMVPVTPLPREKIVDTNGAGDAFTGGFISQMVLGKPYTTCARCGIYAAAHIIQNSGCTFTGESQFKE